MLAPMIALMPAVVMAFAATISLQALRATKPVTTAMQ
jgi:hypothetical protein